MLLDDKLRLIQAIAYCRGYYRTPKDQVPKCGEVRGMELLDEASEIVMRQVVEYVPAPKMEDVPLRAG